MLLEKIVFCVSSVKLKQRVKPTEMLRLHQFYEKEICASQNTNLGIICLKLP